MEEEAVDPGSPAGGGDAGVRSSLTLCLPVGHQELVGQRQDTLHAW